jgi:hypothetical protein
VTEEPEKNTQPCDYGLTLNPNASARINSSVGVLTASNSANDPIKKWMSVAIAEAFLETFPRCRNWTKHIGHRKR